MVDPITYSFDSSNAVPKLLCFNEQDAAPETAGDFERLLVASPNDSLLWVKYMAFKLSLAEVEVLYILNIRVYTSEYGKQITSQIIY